jgi:hypothetical protein
MSLAIIYSDKTQECDRAVSLMQSLEHKFVEYVLGRDFTEAEFKSEFGEEATYPQIAVGIKHIGSLKETLQHFNHNGEL